MSERARIVIGDAFEWGFLAALSALPGVQVVYLPLADRQALTTALQTADAFVFKSKVKVDASLVANAPRLRLVVRAGVGVEHIDQQALQIRGIRLISTPGGNANAVAEHAIGTLLALMNHIVRANHQVRTGQWVREANRGHELSGRTVGIVGYGYTGRALARRLSGFGCRVLAYDKYISGYSDEYATEATLEQIQAEATVLSFHVPLTPETIGYYDNAFMDQMRHPHWVLNLARGRVVSLDALDAGLSYGKVLGAGLDVLDDEPPQDMPPALYEVFQRLLEYDNVIVTPHIGGWSVESAAAINAQVLDSLAQEFAPPVLTEK